MTQSESLQDQLDRATDAARKQRFTEAEELLEGVIRNDPKNLKALDLYGFVRFFQGRFGDAEAYCRRALDIKPDHAYALKGLGLCLARQNRLDEGVESLEKAIAIKPTWFDPYWDLAVVLSDGGRHHEAIKVLSRGQVAVPEGRGKLAQLADAVRKRMETD